MVAGHKKRRSALQQNELDNGPIFYSSNRNERRSGTHYSKILKKRSKTMLYK